MYQHIHIHIFFCTFKNKLFSVSNLALSTLRTSTNLAVLSTAFTFPKPTCSRSCKENEKRNSHSNFKVTKTFETFYLSQTTKKMKRTNKHVQGPRPDRPILLCLKTQWYSVFSEQSHPLIVFLVRIAFALHPLKCAANVGKRMFLILTGFE